jgi:hypothetical protein
MGFKLTFLSLIIQNFIFITGRESFFYCFLNDLIEKQQFAIIAVDTIVLNVFLFQLFIFCLYNII